MTFKQLQKRDNAGIKKEGSELRLPLLNQTEYLLLERHNTTYNHKLIINNI